MGIIRYLIHFKSGICIPSKFEGTCRWFIAIFAQKDILHNKFFCHFCEYLKITCILALILSRLPDITSWYIQQDWKRFYRRFKLALDRTLTGEGMNTNGQYYCNIMHCAAWILNFSNIRKNRRKHWYISFCFYFNCFVCFLVCIIHPLGIPSHLPCL